METTKWYRTRRFSYDIDSVDVVKETKHKVIVCEVAWNNSHRTTGYMKNSNYYQFWRREEDAVTHVCNRAYAKIESCKAEISSAESVLKKHNRPTT